jgi:hypothetical protein
LPGLKRGQLRHQIQPRFRSQAKISARLSWLAPSFTVRSSM